jgi:hypothetical protein
MRTDGLGRFMRIWEEEKLKTLMQVTCDTGTIAYFHLDCHGEKYTQVSGLDYLIDGYATDEEVLEHTGRGTPQ